MTYTVVLLDGKERQNLSLEEVKELFFRRQINQNSLLCTNENPQWQMLKRHFDVSQWIPSGAPQLPPPTNYQNNFQPQQPVFEQPNSYNQPITFNQFPQNQPSYPNNNFAQNTSNGYSQNNQSETYYQAETNQSQYNFQNNQSNFAPSNYNQPSNSHYNRANTFNNSSNFSNSDEKRNGIKPAAAFLLVNAFFYVAFMIFGSAFTASDSGVSEAYNAGRTTGSFLPLIIDLMLAIMLWKTDETEAARRWVLARTYFGFFVFGLIIPLISFKTGDIFLGVFSFVSTFFYFISLTLVLHGKENPSQSRVMVGMGTFAIYFLLMFGTIALSTISQLSPNLGQFEIADRQFEKYKIEGTEFQDKTTGAKVVLPEGWSMIKLSNPLIHSPEARMIAVDKLGNSLTMLEVVPVPANLNMKQANSIVILDKLADSVVEHLKNDKDGDGFSGKGGFREITRMNIYIGKHPAKLLVFEKNAGGEDAKGHMIITYDELTFYVLHSWCPVKDYDKKQADFTFFEKNFNVPEKINSPFTQSAENEKKKADQKKNF